MKYLLFLGAALTCAFALSGQNVDNARRDWVWPLGYDYYSDSVGVDAVTFDFSGILQGDTMRISYGHQAFEMNYVNAPLCDENGGLLLYTNGCAFGDKNREQVLENDTINLTNAYHLACFENIGLGGSRESLLLPDNYDTDVFHLFSEPLSLFDFGTRSNQFLYQRIRYADNSFVLEVKDYSLKTIDTMSVQDSSFNICHLSACLHSNGKDWWIITSLTKNNSFQKILLTENGIFGPYVQKIGFVFDDYDGATGNSVFSPNGTKFVDYAIHADLQIFDFDRCTGLLSNPLHIPITDSADVYYAAGCAISNNSRYLYVASTYHVYQFDLYATDIASSKIVVAEWDGFNDEYEALSLPMLFYQMQLAPDNKIYCTSPGGRKYIHVIEYPDSAGVSCGFKQHAKLLPTPITGGLPNFPYYRLGAADPPCPVSGLAEVEEGEAASLRVRPNPVAGDLWYETNAPIGTPWLLSSSLGKVMQSGNTTSLYWTRLGLGTLPPGVYILTIQGPQGPVSKRVVKQ